MAYFLKRTNNKKGTYLQIYESYYDPDRKGGAHRSYKPLAMSMNSWKRESIILSSFTPKK